MLRVLHNAPRREYYSRKKKGELKYAVHWGQRKLLITELEFFIYFWDPEVVPNPTIVYAGAAGGQHIPLLAQLFPQITALHLYDPAPFAIFPTEKIYIYNQLFTQEDAMRWSGRDDIFFISDIRTGDYRTMSSEENEWAVMEDMRLQRECVEIMNPVQAHLKFRLPYSDSNPKYLKMEYLAGHSLLQPWAPPTSTETRLIPTKDSKTQTYRLRTWDAVVYEEQLFYHNTVLRNQQVYRNPFLRTQKPIPIDPPELVNDYDSVAEIFLLQAYFKKFNLQGTKKEILQMSHWITKELNTQGMQNLWEETGETQKKAEKTLDGLRQRSVREQKCKLEKFRRRRHQHQRATDPKPRKR